MTTTLEDVKARHERGYAMSDFDERGRRAPDYDEIADAVEERRARRRMTGCACGYPDLPGRCPGPSLCPMANYGAEDDGDE